LTDNQARDHVTKAELALDKDGKFIAMRLATLANLGAYLGSFAPAISCARTIRWAPKAAARPEPSARPRRS